MNLISFAAECFRRSSIYRTIRMRSHQAEFRRWERNGRTTSPPHLVKQRVIRRYATKHHCSTLVETGTFRGDMILAMLNDFRTLYSIELHPELHSRARSLFSHRPHVRLLHGDSGEKISEVLAGLEEPAVFWLDGHFSGGNTAKGNLNTPIIAELDKVLSHNISNHVVLIDDARLFTGAEDYPTLEAIQKQLDTRGRFNLTVEDDVIAITPGVA